MGIQFQPFSFSDFDLTGISLKTLNALQQSVDSGWDKDHLKIDKESELYDALSILDREQNQNAAQKLRDQIFDYLFASPLLIPLQQNGSEETKICDAQIGGCSVYDNPIRSVNQKDQTIYEWRVGVNDWSREDNFVISRKNLRTDRITHFGWDSSLFGSVTKLGTTGEKFYALLRTSDDKGSIIAKLDYSEDKAAFYPIDFGADGIKPWEVGAHYICYADEFFPTSSMGSLSFVAGCSVSTLGGYYSRSIMEEPDLENQSFSNEGFPLLNLDAQHDQTEPYNNDTFREFLQLWAGAYTEGNKGADDKVGLANLKKRFGKEFSQPTILFFAGYLDSLAYYDWHESYGTRGEQIQFTVNAVGDKILATHLNNELTQVGSRFPLLLELRDWLNARPIRDAVADGKDPIVDPKLNSQFIPNQKYGSASKLVRAHVAHLIQNKSLIDRGIASDARFDTERSTQSFHCGTPGFSAYYEFAKKDSFTEEQLNILLDYYTQFATPKYGEFANHPYGSGKIITPGQVSQFSEARLAMNPKSALEDLKYFAQIRLDHLATKLQSNDEQDLQNFAYNIHHIEEVRGFIAMLDQFES